MMKNIKKYLDADNLEIEIYCIGYKSEGESIVIFLKDKDQIIWAGVIDCFKKEINKTEEILKENNYGPGQKKLNFICISHPDYDHIYGMNEIFENYTDENTTFIAPNFLQDNYKPTESTKEIIEYFRQKFSKINDINYNNLYLDRCFDPGLAHQFINHKNRKIRFEIRALTPYNSYSFSKMVKREENINKNDYSMMLVFEIDNINLLFCSDCENEVIDRIELDEIPDNIYYFKIPHHGSNTSSHIIENWIEENKKIDIAVCGTRTKNNTTNIEILNGYYYNSNEVHMTASINKDYNVNNYGIIKLNCKNMQTDNLIHMGNALKYEVV